MAKAKSILDIIRDASESEGWECKTPLEHVQEYLEDSELDGLWLDNSDLDGCGCKADDLMPCGFPMLEDCRVGVMKPCPGTSHCPVVGCSHPGDTECCIGPEEEA